MGSVRELSMGRRIHLRVMNNFEQSSWVTTDASDNIITLGYRYTISSGSQFPNAIVVLKYT
jgi:hypothetical protein